jgi:hypothetical protein
LKYVFFIVATPNLRFLFVATPNRRERIRKRATLACIHLAELDHELGHGVVLRAHGLQRVVALPQDQEALLAYWRKRAKKCVGT